MSGSLARTVVVMAVFVWLALRVSQALATYRQGDPVPLALYLGGLGLFGFVSLLVGLSLRWARKRGWTSFRFWDHDRDG